MREVSESRLLAYWTLLLSTVHRSQIDELFPGSRFHSETPLSNLVALQGHFYNLDSLVDHTIPDHMSRPAVSSGQMQAMKKQATTGDRIMQPLIIETAC